MTDRPTTVPDVLTAAAEVIERQGWIQGSLGLTDHVGNGEIEGYIEDTPVCARGATSVAATGYPAAENELTDECVARLARHLGFEQSLPRNFVAGWNDTDGRTADEVVTALRAAAEGARS